eukprot:jgi/Tetstr1/445753/TSEL_033401.t1
MAREVPTRTKSNTAIDGLRDCCVPGCKVGTLIDSTRRPLSAGSKPIEEPNSATAGGACDLISAAATTPQRREDSGGEREGEDGGDDSDAWLETERQKKENALPYALKPKASWREPLKIAWVDAVDITNKRKKPPKNFTKLQQERWYEGRAALRKYRNALRSKRAREQKKSGKATGEEVSPHEAVPEYRVAAGLPTMEASDRAPAVTVHEIARLVHTLCDPDEKHKKHYDALVDWVDKRPEADHKVGRLKPWKFFTEKFNDPTYQPTNFFVDNDMDVDMDLLDVKPGQRPVAFRKDTNLKGWWQDLKGILNTKQEDYTRSGINADGDNLPKSRFAGGDLKMYALATV